MNVLHWHLTDFCRASFESKKYPILTEKLKGIHEGYYKQETVKEIIEYAKERCIRIIPEIDIPGHSSCFSSLSEIGMEFCTDKKVQIYTSPKSLEILKGYFDEVIDVFPDNYIHIGADEVSNEGKCSVNTFKELEEEIFEYLHLKGKTPIGWEEILYSSHSAKPYCVINAWKNQNGKNVVKDGYNAIESSHRNFYLDYIGSNKQWVDISTDYTNNSKILGGEVSMWTDQYLYECQCGAKKPIYIPRGKDLYYREKDDKFHESILSLIFPRTITAAGSFWRFDNKFKYNNKLLDDIIEYHNIRLIYRDIITCPNKCKCDEISKCGNKYI